MSIPNWTKEYVGIPFKDKGRGHEGVDCWGLCRLIWEDRFGLSLPDYLGTYGKSIDSKDVSRVISYNGPNSGSWNKIEKGKEVIGDGVLLRIGGFPTHIGLVLSPGWMIHCINGKDSALERYDTMGWRHKVVGFYRHEKLFI
jgi:cell wall-associated NlpC family hydrolase